MVMGDMPPPLDPDGAPRAPRGPFCIPLRTSMRPTIASLESRGEYQSLSTTRLLGESVKIYSAAVLDLFGRSSWARDAFLLLQAFVAHAFVRYALALQGAHPAADKGHDLAQCRIDIIRAAEPA